MANIVGRVAMSHGPQLYVPPDLWPNILRREDEIKEVPGMRAETVPEVMERRYNACQEDLATVSRYVDDVNPDVIVLIGDDQRENLLEDNMSPFVVYVGEEATAFRKSRSICSSMTMCDRPPDAMTNTRLSSP